LNLGPFLHRPRFAHAKLECARHRVQRSWIRTLRAQGFETVGLRVELIPMASRHLDRKQDVATLGFVALPAGDLDQVIPEL